MKQSGTKLYKVFIYLVLCLLAISIIIPVGWVFLASIKENSEFYRSPWAMPAGIYFQNFVDAWNRASMGAYVLNSIVVTAMALSLLLVTALPASYVLARFDFPGKRLLRQLFKGGLFINVNYIVVPIFLMFVDAQKFLTSAHVEFMPMLLNNRFMLAVVYASTALPFTIHLLSSYFITLPSTFEEAAAIDGAGYFTTMLKIMIPMAKPSIITVILFNFLSFWNEYIISFTFMTKQELRTLPVGLMNLMAAQNAAQQYGQLYAGMVMVMLPTLILYIFVQKQLTEGMTAGGSKE
ncbi:carbohydrate ABC transporter permease [Aerococcaceae bacterium zg-ZJ1578]|uniref:carbohydrate ABC transporter permease n=1 Tax=Aerococcaceae bacterium zg-252 TaxID=2796928 RepID=UPI001A33A8BA|nr:carbohydrate ABC transporter permease [Aerococcaceae bacterium zg-1578]MBS4461387.1 carbohydrate ABC transporter permease [Aerococcaceae bacterium zg-B36]